jgi:hypothetical protein
VKFEVDGLLRADARTRAEVYAKSLDPVTGWLTCAEVRRLEDLEPEPPAAPTVMDVVNQTTPPRSEKSFRGVLDADVRALLNHDASGGDDGGIYGDRVHRGQVSRSPQTHRAKGAGIPDQLRRRRGVNA